MTECKSVEKGDRLTPTVLSCLDHLDLDLPSPVQPSANAWSECPCVRESESSRARDPESHAAKAAEPRRGKSAARSTYGSGPARSVRPEAQLGVLRTLQDFRLRVLRHLTACCSNAGNAYKTRTQAGTQRPACSAARLAACTSQSHRTLAPAPFSFCFELSTLQHSASFLMTHWLRFVPSEARSQQLRRQQVTQGQRRKDLDTSKR